MSDDIIELGRHRPSVESVVSRLDRHQGRIKSISAVVEWDDGSYDVYHDDKSLENLSFDALILNKYALSLVGDTINDKE